MLAQGPPLTKERELCCGLFLRNFLRFPFHGSMDNCRISRLRKNPVDTQNADGIFHSADINIVSGCSKRPAFSPAQP
jgi:hypothetical protein